MTSRKRDNCTLRSGVSTAVDEPDNPIPNKCNGSSKSHYSSSKSAARTKPHISSSISSSSKPVVLSTLSTRNNDVVIVRDAKSVTLSYGDIFEVVNRDSDEVLLDSNMRVDVLNTGSSDMEYCIRTCYNGKVRSSFHLNRIEWQQVVTFAATLTHADSKAYNTCWWWRWTFLKDAIEEIMNDLFVK